jgi:hypothetical protein
LSVLDQYGIAENNLVAAVTDAGSGVRRVQMWNGALVIELGMVHTPHA